MRSSPYTAVAAGRRVAGCALALALMPAFAQSQAPRPPAVPADAPAAAAGDAPVAAADDIGLAPLDDSALREPPGGWRLQRSSSSSLGAAVPTAPGPGWTPGGPSSVMMQTMLWARRERFGLGFGVEQRRSIGVGAGLEPGAPGTRDAGVLVGLSFATGEHSQLTWAAPLVAQRPEGLWLAADRPGAEREIRLGLEFRKRDPYADLRRGALMKLELSRDTTVSLKPRHGRLSFTLTSRW